MQIRSNDPGQLIQRSTKEKRMIHNPAKERRSFPPVRRQFNFRTYTEEGETHMKVFSGTVTISVLDLIRHGLMKEITIDIPEDTARKLISENLQRIPENYTKISLQLDLLDLLLDELCNIAKGYGVSLAEYLTEEIRKKAEE